MIFIFDSDRTPQDPDGLRLPITWHAFDFNVIYEDATSGEEELPYGIFAETIGFNTPVNFQSEMHPDILKNGGGVEYYNPRIGSRVMSMKCLMRERTVARLGSQIDFLQDTFAPLGLAWLHSSTWPPPSGRPEWTDPWSDEFLGLTFTRMNDGSALGQSAIKTAFPEGKVLLQYAVAPLTLPDPVISATQTGVGAALDISFLILDGGRAFSRSTTSKTGTTQTDIVQVYGQSPAWPKLSFLMAGAGSATHTLTVTGGGTHYAPAALVLDLSGRSNNEVVTVLVRDRKIYVDDVLTQNIFVSGDYPLVPPEPHATLTFTHTNNNNITTITTEWFETMLS